jgi:hypothetical protein
MKKFTQTTTTRLSRHFFILLVLMLSSLAGFSQNVGINSTGAAPNASAGLDVDFPNKGVLIPRIALTGTVSFAPLPAHVAGMIVYNTATAGDVVPGFYYDDGTKWIPGFPAGTAIGNMIYWNGTAWVMIPAGLPGQFLQLNASNIPFWGGGAFATIITTAASAITGNTATTGGNILSDGGAAVLSRGVCYSLTTGPTTANSIVVAVPPTGTGIFVCNLTGLLPGTVYYVRAYATNNSVTSYGNEVSFTTLATIPILAPTTPATLITGTTATTGGNVTSTGGATITERGVVYSTTVTSPTILDTKLVDPSPGPGTFVSNMTGLIQNTLYYVRSYATNSVGTGYGALTTFITTPSVTTKAATVITGGGANTGGILIGAGGFSSVWSYGIAYSITPNSPTPTYITTGNFPTTSPLDYVTILTGLNSNTLYYIRAFAQGSGYTIFGAELNFTTLAATAPVVASTAAITGITANTAISGGAITSDGGSPITAKGVCWSTSANPVLGTGNFTSDGTGMTAFVSNITGLTGNTTYHVRAYATNLIGTSYGPVDVVFTTWIQAPYSIGQNLGYGICGYVDQFGAGIIVSPDIYPTSPATSFTWGCNGTHVAVGTAYGTGKANTDLIIANCGSNNAAGSAKAYNGGGYVDWYLPSNGEWAVFAPVYFYFGLGTNVSYFTSSEYGTNYNYANSYFSTSAQAYSSGSPRVGDAYTTAIRALRSFNSWDVTTDPVTNITSTGGTSGGTVISNGGPAVTARGVCWSTSPAPTLTDPHTSDGSGTGHFTSTITGLTVGITYYVRAYATTAATVYGNQETFVPGVPTLPTVTTDPITNKVGALAVGGGTVLTDGGNPVSAFGVCWGLSANPSLTSNLGFTNDGAGIATYVSSLTGLSIGTIYHVRAYATNIGGTAYGSDLVFTETAATLGQVVTFITGSLSAVVFSVDGTGLHGLMADQYGPFSTADWGCAATLVGANGTAVGTGQANTTAIIASNTLNACISLGPLGSFAAEETQFDGPDWYLPSKDEVTLLWTNRAVDPILDGNLVFAQGQANFWSSSEFDASNAWNFNGTTWFSVGVKADLNYGWPIRSF